MTEIRAVLYNDLHAVRDDCHGKCEQVVTLADHAAALKELSSKLGELEKCAELHMQRCTADLETIARQQRERDEAESRLDTLQTRHDAVERGYFSEMKRAHEAMNALTEIYRLADGISDEMTLPEIGTIALGAIQKPVVENRKARTPEPAAEQAVSAKESLSGGAVERQSPVRLCDAENYDGDSCVLPDGHSGSHSV